MTTSIAPFAGRPLPPLDWKRMVGLVTLAPLRILILIPLLFLLWLTSRIGLLGMNEDQPVKGGHRAILQRINIAIARVMAMVVSGGWLKVNGTIAPREAAPMVVIAPHSSFWDQLVCFWCTPGAVVIRYFYTDISAISVTFCNSTPGAVVIRVEERDRPVFGAIARFMQAIFVDRKSSESRRLAAEEIMRRASGPGWPRIIIFPEGTTTDGTALIRFKVGAFNVGRPVQPVGISYEGTNGVIWTKGSSYMLWVAAYTLATLHTPVGATFLPVVKPSPRASLQLMSSEGRIGADMFAKEVMLEMGRELCLPIYTGDLGSSANHLD